MGKRYSPGEKRLRGFVSGDPLRVERTLRRCQGVADRTIHDHIRAHVTQVREAIAPLTLKSDVRAEIDSYLTRLETGGQASEGCVCGSLSGNPSRFGNRIRRLSNRDFAGHSETQYECVNCGSIHSLTTDVGYHVPQYHWK